MSTHPIGVQVCGFHELGEQIPQGAKSLVSIWESRSPDVDETVRILRKHFTEDCLHVVMFDDIARPTAGKRAATKKDISGILRFAADAPSPVLVHCFAGVSRSAAVAYAILCQAHGPGEEELCMQRLLRVRPQAAPNAFIVSIADDVMKRRGAMNAAYEKVLRLHIMG